VQVRSKVRLSKRLGKIRPPIRRCLATWFSLGIATLPCPNPAYTALAADHCDAKRGGFGFVAATGS